MFSLNAGDLRTAFLMLLILPLFQPAAEIRAETNSWRDSSSVDFAEAPDNRPLPEEDMLWLEESDRLMEELHMLDVRMYSLISRIGDDESLRKLIRQRSLNRRLIYDLLSARNNVVRRIEENNQDAEG